MTRWLVILLFVASALGVLYSNLRDPVATDWTTNGVEQLKPRAAPEYYRQLTGQVPFATGTTSGMLISEPTVVCFSRPNSRVPPGTKIIEC